MEVLSVDLKQKIRDIFDTTTLRVGMTTYQVDRILWLDYHSLSTDQIQQWTLERIEQILTIIAYLKIYWYSADITTSPDQTEAVSQYLHNPHPDTNNMKPIDALAEDPDIWIPRLLSQLETSDPDIRKYFPTIHLQWEENKSWQNHNHK